MTGIILQELLQGASDEQEWRLLEEYFGTQRFLHPLSPIETHRGAARLFFLWRRQGITPRSAVDCLIAQIAIEHQVPLLHSDRDYLQLAQAIPELQLLPEVRETAYSSVAIESYRQCLVPCFTNTSTYKALADLRPWPLLLLDK